MAMNFEQARHNMVEQQVRTWDVFDASVLECLSDIARENFVATEHRAHAYSDVGLPLGHGEQMLKPVVAGRILQSILVQTGMDVLEIGTGSGYLSACMANHGANVTTVEQHADLQARAAMRFSDFGFEQINSICARAFDDFQPEHQFDLVVLTGACCTVPEAAKNWVKQGGKLFAIVGRGPAMQACLFTRINDEQWKEESVFETQIPYLTGATVPKTFDF